MVPVAGVPAMRGSQWQSRARAASRRVSWLLGLLLLAPYSCRICFLAPAAHRSLAVGRTVPRSFGGISFGAKGVGVAVAQEGPEAVEFQVGDTVEAVFPEDGEWYPGTIEKDNGDGTYDVRWEDPDGGPEVSPCKTDEMKKIVPKIPLEDLEIGSKVKGTVKSVRDFGAFVDVGAERDGLVHISKMPKPEAKTGPFESGDAVEAAYPDDEEWYPGTVEKDNGDGTFNVKWDDPDGGPESHAVKSDDMKHAEKSLDWGDEVEVWIEKVYDDKLQLSMMPPPDLSEFQDVHPSEWLDGTVDGIAQFGVFVSVQSPGKAGPQKGLVHISKLKEGFVDDPWSEVEVGQKVKVRVLSVDMDRNKMSLSMVED